MANLKPVTSFFILSLSLELLFSGFVSAQEVRKIRDLRRSVREECRAKDKLALAWIGNLEGDTNEIMFDEYFLRALTEAEKWFKDFLDNDRKSHRADYVELDRITREEISAIHEAQEIRDKIHMKLKEKLGKDVESSRYEWRISDSGKVYLYYPPWDSYFSLHGVFKGNTFELEMIAYNSVTNDRRMGYSLLRNTGPNTTLGPWVRRKKTKKGDKPEEVEMSREDIVRSDDSEKWTNLNNFITNLFESEDACLAYRTTAEYEQVSNRYKSARRKWDTFMHHTRDRLDYEKSKRAAAVGNKEGQESKIGK